LTADTSEGDEESEGCWQEERDQGPSP